MTSSVSGKRSPAELIAPDHSLRWRRESNPCARLCRPLPHHSATPPLGLMPLHLRADDGIRTRDPHLGKVMRYQLRYIRAPRTTRRPSRSTTIVHRSVAAQISAFAGAPPPISTPKRLLRLAETADPRPASHLRQTARTAASPKWILAATLTVLVFDVVRPFGRLSGLVAQWESVRLTRGRSLVRTQPGPHPDHQRRVRAAAARLPRLGS